VRAAALCARLRQKTGLALMLLSNKLFYGRTMMPNIFLKNKTFLFVKIES
jgi:hypothetical protein